MSENRKTYTQPEAEFIVYSGTIIATSGGEQEHEIPFVNSVDRTEWPSE